jgi:uncharacterized protein (TIGR02646 family)
MIYADREPWEVPSVLRGAAADAARTDAKAFFERPNRERGKKPYVFRDTLLRGTLERLDRIFRGKCAYCERHLGKKGKIIVDRFRPAERYWWLAYEWTNLFPACEKCHASKGKKFPVKKRARAGATGNELLAERPLLLDPCVDAAEKFFFYTEDGRVLPSPKCNSADRARARATIKILRLNRPELRKERAIEMEKVAEACRKLEGRRGRVLAGTGSAMAHPATHVRRVLRAFLPYGAARRQVVRQVLSRFGSFGEQVLSLLPELASPQERKRWAELARLGRKRRPAYVKEVRIRNFKAIRDLHLTFDNPSLASDNTQPAGWKVFLGENGAGKSTLLQALALALGGELGTRQALMNWDKLLRRPRGKRPRPRDGFVRVTLDSGDVIDMRFTNKKVWFLSGAEGARTSVRAYGSTRNLPNTRAPASWKSVEAMIRTINLFDSNSPLVSAEGWIGKLPKQRFNVVANAVQQLLRMESGNWLRIEKRVGRRGTREPMPVLDIGNTTSTLDELSDGYQSMLALAADIMAGLPKKSEDFKKEAGIVLIDELGNHLHPRWRMQVVSSLRAAFPQMQFIASTHEPLCLRGLKEKETVILRSDDYGVVTAETDLPSPADYRIEQLLTSDFFGLYSTDDPAAERVFREYYALLARNDPADTDRVRDLHGQLKGRRHMGNTFREDLMYAAIDQVLAQRKEEPLPMSEVQQSVIDDVMRIWNEPAFASRSRLQ